MSALRLVPCGLFVRHKFKLITFWWPFSNNFSLFFPGKTFFGRGGGGYLFIGVSKLNYGRKAAVPYCGQQSLASLLPLPNLLTFLRARLLRKGSNSFFKNKIATYWKLLKRRQKIGKENYNTPGCIWICLLCVKLLVMNVKLFLLLPLHF